MAKQLTIRERLEHEAQHSTDARSRMAALRELRLLNKDEGVDGGESRQRGLEVPWPEEAESAMIAFYSAERGEQPPTTFDPDRMFVVHRGREGDPEYPSIIVYPRPIIGDDDPTPVEDLRSQDGGVEEQRDPTWLGPPEDAADV